MSEISVGSLCDDTQSWLKWLVAVQHVRKRRSACDAFLAKKTKKKNEADGYQALFFLSF